MDHPPDDSPISDNDLRFQNVSWLSPDCLGDTDSRSPSSPLGPFPNCSQFRLTDWWYNASLTKSQEDFNNLLDLLRSKGFSVGDLEGLQAQQAQKLLDDFASPTGVFSARDGWRQGSVEVPLPKTKATYPSEQDAPTATVPGLFFRRLIEVLTGVAMDPRFADSYHWIPHVLQWKPPARNGPEERSEHFSPSPPPPPDPVRVFTDLFNAKSMEHEFDAIRGRPRNPQDAPEVEYGLLPLMFWSDATHLTAFGSASLWPIYLYIGALSKYIRGMPTEFAAHHIAYLPSLPDTIHDLYTQEYGTAPSADVLTFCKRELMQRIWLLLLDDDFMEAYKHGILVKCADGITRRLFPRIFTYSADYPEKILLSALKPLAKCPCPRCLTPLTEAPQSGTPDGMARASEKRVDDEKLRRDIQKARDLVFKKGCSLASKRVQALLDARSLNPIQTAFSKRLSPFGVNFYDFFVPDLMHEFELGVWKGTFAHLLRLLDTQGDDVVTEFNRRMRSLPTFGRDTIRKFWDNIAPLPHVHSYCLCTYLSDSVLRLPIPFHSIVNFNNKPTTYLYWAWDVLDTQFGYLVFQLITLSPPSRVRYNSSHPLLRRPESRLRIPIILFSEDLSSQVYPRTPDLTPVRTPTSPLPFSVTPELRVMMPVFEGLLPLKDDETIADLLFELANWHALAKLRLHTDVTLDIFCAATADMFAAAELEHRHAKHYYVRTNKIEYTGQIADHQRRESILRSIRTQDGYTPRHERLRVQREAARNPSRPRTQPSGPAYDDREDDLPTSDPLNHYSISQSSRLPLSLGNWLAENNDDPATENFISQLHSHLFMRIYGDIEDLTLAHLDGIEVHNNRIYRHKVLRLNYTAYNMRREQDTINPHTHADVMTLAPDDSEHPFWYGRVIDIFHAQVRYTGPDATPAMTQWRRVEFLRIRWYENDPDYLSGFTERRLPRIRFVREDDPLSCAFSFIDPGDVIRAAYILPAFAHGTTTSLLRPSELARLPEDEDKDFNYYYVCIFADRDIYMRHLGGGVGHCGVGIDLETSRGHALRTTPAGYPADDLPNSGLYDAAMHNNNDGIDGETDEDMDDEDIGEQDMREDGWWWDGECDDEADEFFARDSRVPEGDEAELGMEDQENHVYTLEGLAPL
ncbi:hypothetical protein BN946_scf184823.g1 [Trametes cinnabarina]|uniref:Uncharacterized protein n=1 Tax=Pycnoporus cinnabarinus TaxID=5643 RepID=A0A060SLQ1_PYCCI|nr:hypothetical protein BN946_scf184823.g1 [Trametes cinnabarina]